jgi:NADH dehydrogenase
LKAQDRDAPSIVPRATPLVADARLPYKHRPMKSDDATAPHVVILGGGFGGLAAARALRGAPVRVTLVDRQNHHLFQPLLYQVATAALNPSDIAAPLRHVLRAQANATVLLADARRVDVGRRVVVLADGELAYDHLIVATGATHSYFGHDEWAHHAPGLKTLEDAVEIRQRFLLAFEAAEREPDPARRDALLTFVIIGAGPTGVEMAGAMAEIARHTLAAEFHRIDPRKARVVLVEGLDRVLPVYAPELSESARAELVKRGVEVRTGVRVTGIEDEYVLLDGERLPACTAVWAAGVAGSPLGRSLGAPVDRAGRVLVETTLGLPGRPEVHVIGDLAAVTVDGAAVPGVAQGAIQGGQHAAENIRRALRGEAPASFHYKDLGSMATIGRNAAVADVNGTRLTGLLAWGAWLAVHILALVDFRNRVFVVLSWAWSYLTLARGARLITRKVPPTLISREGPDDPVTPSASAPPA